MFITPTNISPKYTSTAKRNGINEISDANRRYSLVSTYSNDSMETTDLSWDHSDVHSRMEELQITNKRLLEENYKLKRNLDATEDHNSSVINENDYLKAKVVRCEKLLDDGKHVTQGYEELKSTVVEYENLKNDLKNKLFTLEKENNSLQATIQDYELKVNHLDNSVYILKEEKEKLAEDLSTQKKLLNQIEDLKTSHENIVEESATKSEYLASVIAELSLANEVLKAQKTNIESELSDLKQEVCRASMMNGFAGDMVNTPLLSSTKIDWPQSLHQELKAELQNDSDAFRSPTRRFPSIGSESSCETSPYKEKYSIIAKQCREKFKEKKEIVITKIDEIVNGRYKGSEKIDTSIIVDDLNQELESFTEKITEFAQGKQEAERRALKLVSAVRKLKDENDVLQESRDKALLKFGDLSITNLESEEKLKVVSSNIEEKIQQIQLLTQEIELLKETHKEEVSTLETQLSDSSNKNIDHLHRSHRKEIEDLKNLVEDLKVINIDKSKKLYDLEDKLQSKVNVYEELKAKHDHIVSLLESIQRKHQVELQTIFRIVPNQTQHSNIEILSYEDIKEALEIFLTTTKHEYNKLMGVRESPDGGPHLTDTLLSQDLFTKLNQVDYHAEKHIAGRCDLSETVQNTKRRCSVHSQTEIDMLAMNKIYENYDKHPPSQMLYDSYIEENNNVINMIPVEELPEDISIIDNELFSVTDKFLDEQLLAVSNGDKVENIRLSENVPNLYTNDIDKDFIETSSVVSSKTVPYQISFIEHSECDTSRSSPTGKSGESSVPTEQSDFSFDNNVDNTRNENDENNNNNNNTNEHEGYNDQNRNENDKHLENNYKSETNYTPPSINEYEKFESELVEDNIDNEECISNSKENENLLPKPFNLNVVNIIEFDRSDISSDSEGEGHRRSSASSRRRHRATRRSRLTETPLEETDECNKNNNDEDNDKSVTKRRRHGVSAEPVRVSWSALRESFKKQHFQDVVDLAVEDVENTEEDSQPLIVTVEDVETSEPPLVILTEQEQLEQDLISENNSIDLPNTADETTSESSNTNNNNTELLNGSCSSPIESNFDVKTPPLESPEKSPKHSLQVPPGIIFESMMDSLPLRYQLPFQENKELEKKFNNAVFSFNTDQYTLQKRLENQERARDVAESGMDKELQKLKSSVHSISRLQKGTSEYEDAFQSLLSESSILQKAAMKISAQSEQHGCYQQESRQAPNVDIMIKYADHLRIHVAKLMEEIAEYRKRVSDPERWAGLPPRPEDSNENLDSIIEDEGETNNVEELEVTTDSTTKSNRKSFSSISRSLIMAQGLSKLNSRRSENSSSYIKRRKRVSFGQIDYSDDVIDLNSQPSSFLSTFLDDHRSKIYKLLILIFGLLCVYLFMYLIMNAVEVDNKHKLIDKILHYIPHTIEYRKKPDGR